MQTEQRFRELLDRYIAGTCTSQEKAIMEEWFEKGGDMKKADLQLSAEDEALLLNNIHRLQDKTTVPDSLPVHRSKLLRPLSSWRAAAVWMGVLITAGAGIWKAGTIQYAATPAQTAAVFKEIATGKGEIKQVVLPDSSVVLLNAGSTLHYHSDFARHRQVQLSGEALFTVTHDDKHPFTVQTADSLATLVLGTQFNISSYAQGEDIQISVVSGKVQVSKPGSAPDILTRAQAIHYNKASRDYTIQHAVSVESLTSWAKGEWDYENVRFNDLVVLLQNQYGVALHTRRNPHQLQTNVNVNFNKEQSASEIVEVFCSLTGCRFRIITPAEIEIY